MDLAWIALSLPGHLDFISFLDCALLLAGGWPQTTIPNERAHNYLLQTKFPVA